MIEVHQLSKTFETGKGKQKKVVNAVKDVSFAAASGRITGLLGPNGAGKTTTMRMLCTLVVPTSGRASVDGLDCATQGEAVRTKLGVLSDARGLYQRLTTRENIRYFGQLQGLANSVLDERVETVIEQIGLQPLADRRTEGFSQGERMKVALARALVHNPPNLILDEPTNGLDIMTIRSLRQLLRDLRDQGKCILLSTHIMQEVTALADEVVIISQGSTVAQGSVPQLLARAGATDLEEAFVKLAFGTHAGEAAHPHAELVQ
jgi:sodium transport system ATP-binding protein